MSGDNVCRDKVRKEVHCQSIGEEISNQVKQIKQTDCLESAARSATAHFAGAVTIAADVDLGQFGDGHNWDSGVKGDAERNVW